MDDEVWFPWKYLRYKRATAHLDHYQDSCYRRIIDYYMETRRGPPDNDVALARIVGDSVEGWLKHGAAIVRAFFYEKDGRLLNETCEEILAEQEHFKAVRSRAGKAGADKVWKKKKKLKDGSANSQAIAEPMAKHAKGQDITGQEVEVPPSPRKAPVTYVPSIFEIDPLFPPVFAAFPGMGKNGQGGVAFKGQKAHALEAFREIYKEAKECDREKIVGRIVEACGRYEQFLKSTGTPGRTCANWLRARGWEDDYTVAPDARRTSGYSVAAATALASADQTGNPEGRTQRLKKLGIDTAEGGEG